MSYTYNNNNYQSNQQNTSEYYGNQSYNPQTRLQTTLDTSNISTGSLGGATAIETPRVNPTENVDEIDSINSQSRSGSILTKRDSRGPLVGQNTSDLGNQYYPDYNKSGGFGFPKQNKYQGSSYYDEEATRHNTLTSGDPQAFNFEKEYTDRDFPGSGKNSRQSMTNEHLTIPDLKRKRKCCGCCTWPICILVTIIILVALGITAFFVLPRIPTVNIKDPIPTSPPNISTNPPLINMNFTIPVEIDNEKNYVPYKFNRIEVSIFDRNVNNSDPVATGTQLDYTLVPKTNDTIYFPIMVNYTSQSSSDPVVLDFISACSSHITNHTPLKLKVNVVLYIWGIDWIYKPTISVPVPDVNCPTTF